METAPSTNGINKKTHVLLFLFLRHRAEVGELFSDDSMRRSSSRGGADALRLVQSAKEGK